MTASAEPPARPMRSALAASVLLWAQGHAQMLQTDARGTFVRPEPERAGVTATLSTDLVAPQVFVADDAADNPALLQSLTILPGYGLSDALSLQADAKIAWEYTAPDDSRSTTDDIFLRLIHAPTPRGAVGWSAAGSAALPVSRDSRRRDIWTKGTGALGLHATLSRLTVVGASSATKVAASAPSNSCGRDPDGILLGGREGACVSGSFAYDAKPLLVACSRAAGACAGTSGRTPDRIFKGVVDVGL